MVAQVQLKENPGHAIEAYVAGIFCADCTELTTEEECK